MHMRMHSLDNIRPPQLDKLRSHALELKRDSVMILSLHNAKFLQVYNTSVIGFLALKPNWHCRYRPTIAGLAGYNAHSRPRRKVVWLSASRAVISALSLDTSTHTFASNESEPLPTTANQTSTCFIR